MINDEESPFKQPICDKCGHELIVGNMLFSEECSNEECP
jgi:hypothetical protein